MKNTLKLSHQISVRITSKDWENIKVQAQKENLLPTAWIRKILLDALKIVDNITE